MIAARTATFLALAAAAVSLARAAEVAAQPQQQDIDEATREQAREHYRRGRQLFQRDRAEEALRELETSYSLMPHWATSNGMALCADRLGDTQGALRLYERAVVEGGDTIPQDQRGQINDRIASLRRELGIGRLAVQSTPPGAALTVSGVDVGATPFEGDLLAGSHSLALRLEGYEPQELAVAVGAAEARTVEVAMVPVPEQVAPPVEATGKIDVESDPGGAEVLVDGSRVGSTPLRGAGVAAGERSVRVQGPDGRSWEDRVTVAAGTTVRIDVDLPGRGVSPAWFWAALGTAAAAGVGMAATGGYAWSLHDEYLTASPARRDEIRPTGEALQDASDALLGVTSAAAAGALVLLFLTDFDEPEPSASIAVVPAAGEGADAALAALPRSDL